MKKIFLLFPLVAIASFRLHAQTNWPQVLKTSMGAVIKLYEPQPDSLAGNNLWYHSAFSYLENGKTTPQFGSYQADARVGIDRDDRIIRLDTVTVLQLDLRGVDPALSRRLVPLIGMGLTGLGAEVSLDAVLSSLDMATAARSLSRDLETRPPRIVYADRPSILVTIDGEPYIQQNREFRMDAVVNTPFIILKHQNTWYLYGGRHWYAGISPTGPYSYVPAIPPDMAGVQAAMDLADSALGAHSDTAREGADIVAGIIVTTTPAELIQTTGEPGFAPIAGTGLLYVTNSANDIFLDTRSQSYFVLLSGRWYRAPALQGNWNYVPADSLPSDFAHIPEGSPKDNVLASVAGTAAAREAVVDAQIPQTAEIDRKTATVQIVYDGEPRFTAIRGTGMQYAVNTASTVILSGNRYYCAENGAWYIADGPRGPWSLAATRPGEVELIPPDCPVYACKYLYVFEVTPGYICMGYTPGYLGNFIYGPTVVYGTGFYYAPWRGSGYYSRSWTWGFNMWYDPWYGWTLGYDFGPDWFNFAIDWGWPFWTGGWWGPAIYRPPYVWHHFRGHGLYERDVHRVVNVDIHNNLYGVRRDLSRRPANDRVYADRQGNVYRKAEDGGWQQRDGDRWKPLDGHAARTIDQLNRQEQQRSRGVMRIQNFRQLRGGGIPGGGINRGPGGRTGK